MSDKLSYLLEENKEHRYTLYKEIDGQKTKLDQCDRITAEGLALEAQKEGISVQWQYLEDQFLSPQPLW